MKTLYCDARQIIDKAIAENLPQEAVEKALREHDFHGGVVLVAIGKAAWTMAKAARDTLGDQIKRGVVITKYDHAQGVIPGLEIVEAGHPLSDENTIRGTETALQLVESLAAGETVLFLISGGGSALFEKPLAGITLDDIVDVNQQLLACGADIVEMNMIRKRLSSVKGGRFAQLCAPHPVFTVVLSDVLGDRLDTIASGPAAPDDSTAEQATAVVKKYNLRLPELLLSYLAEETPKRLDHVETIITGSVTTLCRSAAEAARRLGYHSYVMAEDLNCEAKEAGKVLASVAKSFSSQGPQSGFLRPCALIFGGETVVRLVGKGKGGRNQELALSAAEGIAGLDGVAVFSVGSDGTDGPTDAAGGIVDGTTAARLRDKGIKISDVLANNDAYHALQAVNGLLITGPTGTNVNDISVILIR